MAAGDNFHVRQVTKGRMGAGIAKQACIEGKVTAGPEVDAILDQAIARCVEVDALIIAAYNWDAPPTTGYTVEDLIANSTGNHEGVICGVAGYDWEKHGVIQSPSPTGSQMTAWGVANWDCGKQQAGVVFQIRNPRGYALANGIWTQLTDEVNWVASMNPQTNKFDGPNPGPGPVWEMPNAAFSIHFGSNEHANLPANTVGVVSLFEARIVSGSVGGLMIGAGADYWSGSGNVGAVVGAYAKLTSNWKTYGASSVDAATLRRVGLPTL